MRIAMSKVRAEEGALLLWDKRTAGTAYVSGEELGAVAAWVERGVEGGFIQRLKGLGVLAEDAKEELRAAIVEAGRRKAPLRSFCAPESLHIELTTRCPLRCPQCYKGHGKATDLPWSRLREVIAQADDMQVFQMALGGGEPMTYPHLLEAVEEIAGRGMSCSITTSGAGLTRKALARLMAAGLDHVQVSLNGSTAPIHSFSREGFETGVEALRMLMDAGLSHGVNWVARRDNVEDVPAVISLAKGFEAGNINILRYKPSPAEAYEDVKLTSKKMHALKEIPRDTKGIAVKVDAAFSNLLCMLSGRPGAFGGCGAGRRFVVLDAQGRFRPCSHVALAESTRSLSAYWTQSAHLALFREVEDRISEPCSGCSFLKGCRGCRAIAAATGDFFAGDGECCLV